MGALSPLEEFVLLWISEELLPVVEETDARDDEDRLVARVCRHLGVLSVEVDVAREVSLRLGVV